MEKQLPPLALKRSVTIKVLKARLLMSEDRKSTIIMEFLYQPTMGK